MEPILPDLPAEGPGVLRTEHAYLLQEVRILAARSDSTGAAAKKVYEVMEHHFREEEDFVLPLLAELPRLISGKDPGNPDRIIEKADKLKDQYNHMIAEHQMIRALVREMEAAAVSENVPVAFISQLHQHAQAEEEIHFPAALLAGQYAALRKKSKD